MSNQEESPSILKALADLREGHHPLAMSILAEMEIMRHVEMHRSVDEIDEAALHDLHKRITDHVVSGVHEVLSTGGHKETRTGPAAQGHMMLPGQVLNPGCALRHGEFALIYGTGGDLRFDRMHRSTLWESGTQVFPAGPCVLEEDGNLVIYDSDGKPIWMTGTWGHPGSKLIVEQEGYAVIERPPGPFIPPIEVWSTDWLLGTVRMYHATGITAMPAETTLTVPQGRKILCGGARQSGGGTSTFLTASFPKDARTWVAKAEKSSPASIDVWAITISDPYDACEVLIFGGSPGSPSDTAAVPGNYVRTGGGAQAGEGSLLVASVPGGSDSWVAVSKTPIAGQTASVTAYAIGIRASDRSIPSIREIFERKMFETKIFANTGASASCPSAEISTIGGYVLVGGGAAVNCLRGESNFLTASYPEGKTWKVASKEHIQSGACTITACAIGARVGSGTLFRP